MEQSSQVTENGRPRQRAPSTTHLENRAAKQLISDIQRRLERWHRRIAFLRGLTVGGRGTQAQTEAAELAALVIATRIEFEGLLEGAPERVAHHSLVRDINRSLKLLREELEDLADGRAASPVL